MEIELPSLMLVTSRHQMEHTFEYALECALLGGASLIQLRESGLEPAVYSYLAQLTASLCHRYKALLLINEQVETARLIADGAHFPESILQKDALPEIALKGVSVHSVENAKLAEDRGANYVIYGHIFATESHPESSPVGLDALKQVVESVNIPVYAIGGISAANAKSCLEVGAHGVVVMSAAWNAPDVLEAVRELKAALV